MKNERSLIILPAMHTYRETGAREVTSESRHWDSIVRKYFANVFRYLESGVVQYDGLKTFCDALTVNHANTLNTVLLHDRPDVERYLGVSLEETPTTTLLYYLRLKGGTLMGTEHPALVDAYRRASSSRVPRNQNRLDVLIEYRDRAIAKNVDTGLDNGENGLLIIGGDHEVQKFLPEDISWKIPKEIFQGIRRSEVESFVFDTPFLQYLY